MAPISVEVPNLVGGVSQQPPKSRLPGKLEDADNVWLDPAQGAIRRPPSFWIANAWDGSTPPSRALVPIDLNGEVYFALIREEEVEVYDSAGNQIQVEGPRYQTTTDLRYLDRQEYGENYIASAETIYSTWTVVSGTVGFDEGQNPGPFMPDGVFGEHLLLVTDGGGGSSAQVTYTFTDLPATRPGHRAEFFVHQFGGATMPDDFTAVLTFQDDGVPTQQPLTIRWDWSGAAWSVGSASTGMTGYVLDLGDGWWRLRVDVVPNDPYNQLVKYDLKIQNAAAADRVLQIWGLRDSYYDAGAAALDPQTDLQWLTVQDFTFVLNRRKRAALGSRVSKEEITAAAFVGDDRAFIDCQWTASTKYVVRWKTSADAASQEITHSTGTGTADSDGLATSLAAAINAAGSTSITATAQGATVLLDPGSGNTFDSLEVRDGQGNLRLRLVWKTVESISDLPLVAPDGFVVRIDPAPGSSLDDHYVVFERESDPTVSGELQVGEGLWRETTQPGTALDLDEVTMPYQLVRRFDDAFGTVTGTAFEVYFEWGPVAWVERQVGNDETNLVPSFVGQFLTDLTFHRNRLAISALESAALSEAGSYFNFWRTTTIAVPDSDPIDVAASHTERSDVRNMVGSDEALLLFSDETVFAVTSGGNPLTPETATIRPILKLQSEADASPVLFGSSVLAPSLASPAAAVYSVYQRDVDLWGKVDLTREVPTYIDSAIRQMAAAPRASFLLVRTADALRVWFNARDEEGKAVQSAWASWGLTGYDSVEGVAVVDDDLWLLLNTTNQQHLVRLPLDPEYAEAGETYAFYLDSRVNPLAKVYDPVGDETRFDLPRDALAVDEVVDATTGNAFVVTERTDDYVKVEGDQTILALEDVVVGAQYVSSLVLTPPYPKLPSQLGGLSARRGRMQVTFCRVDVEDTNHVRALVDMTGRAQATANFAASGPLATVNLADGVFRFLVAGNPDDALRVELRTIGHLPMRLVAAAWEGEFFSGTQPYGSA